MDLPEKKKEMKIRLPARLENLEELINFTLHFLSSCGVDKETASEIHLAVDEACTNSIKYAYPPGREGELELSCALTGDSVIVTIRDWGKAFNPLESPPPDLDLGIEERPIGGLGIFLMKKFSDRLEYRRENNSNFLTIIKKII